MGIYWVLILHSFLEELLLIYLDGKGGSQSMERKQSENDNPALH